MTFPEIINKVSEELDLPTNVVEKTYRGYWSFIRDSIQKLPLKDIDEEGFSNLRTNFNIPSLGKLSCTKERWLGVKKRHKYINNLRRSSNAEDY